MIERHEDIVDNQTYKDFEMIVDSENESDSSDSEGVLSEVHISPCKPLATSYNRKRFVSQFPIYWPSTVEDSQISTNQSSSTQQLMVDDDGDLLLPRRPQQSHSLETIYITHALSTPLHSVGLQVWRGALLLADFILFNETKFKDCYALELGSGSGFVGIVLARVAKKVYLTDHNVEVLENCLQNIHLNQHLFRNQNESNVVATVRYLDWTDPSSPSISCQNEEEKHIPKEFQWQNSDDLTQLSYLFAADVIYDNTLTLALFEKLRTLMTPQQTLFLSLEKRINFTIEDLKPTAKAYDYFCSLISNNQNQNSHLTGSFVVQKLPIDFPQYFAYERTKELELWEIKYTLK